MTDAWVFSSIAASDPDAANALVDVVRHADALNHAIPTEAEFAGAMGRLTAAGLVDADPNADRFWLTDAGARLHSRLDSRGMFAWMELIPPGLHRIGGPQDSEWSLPDGFFDRAVREYSVAFDRKIKGSGPRKRLRPVRSSH
jgi:hypothetical protein